MKQREDRRIGRTRQLLREALFSLIKEQGFEALSVQQIIDRANIGRATFYSHFDNKEDLLICGFDELRSALRERQRIAYASGGTLDDRVFAFSHDVFTHCDKFRDVFQIMVAKGSGTTIKRVLHQLVLELMREEIRRSHPRNLRTSIENEATIQFLSGGLFGLLMWWLAARKPCSIDMINDNFRCLAISALRVMTTGIPATGA